MAGVTEDPILGIGDIREKETQENSKHVDKVVGVVGKEGGQGERDMATPAGSLIHRSGSRPQLDLSKAAIEGNFEERNPTILLPNQSDDIFHLALDIGGIIHLCVFRQLFYHYIRYDFLFNNSVAIIIALSYLCCAPHSWDVYFTFSVLGCWRMKMKACFYVL